MSKKNGRTVYIMYIPGGAVWGLLPAVVMDYVEKTTELRIAEMFNVLAGTSTGAIIAAGLSVPDPENPKKPLRSAEHLVEKFKYWSPKILPKDPNLHIRQLGMDLVSIGHEKLDPLNNDGLLRMEIMKLGDALRSHFPNDDEQLLIFREFMKLSGGRHLDRKTRKGFKKQYNIMANELRENQAALDTLSKIRARFMERRKKQNFFQKIGSFVLRRVEARIEKPFFDETPRRECFNSNYVLENKDGSKHHVKLSEALRSLHITAFNIGKNKGASFRNWKDDLFTIGSDTGQDVSHDLALTDIVMGSTAVPSLFPAHTAQNGESYIDIAFVESPLRAVISVLETKPEDANVKLVVFGTGEISQTLTPEEYNTYGFLNLMRSEKGSALLNSMQTTAQMKDMDVIQHLLGEENVLVVDKSLVPKTRLEQRRFPSPDCFDAEPENMEKIISFGHSIVDDHQDTLNKLCAELFENAVKEGIVEDNKKIWRVRKRLIERCAYDEEQEKTLRRQFNKEARDLDDETLDSAGILQENAGIISRWFRFGRPKKDKKPKDGPNQDPL